LKKGASGSQFRPEPVEDHPALAPLLSYSPEVVKYSAGLAMKDLPELRERFLPKRGGK
jgi:hypothetical protein